MTHPVIGQATRLVRLAGSFASEHAPIILTGAAVAGTINTAFLASRASWRAAERVQTAIDYELDTMIEPETFEFPTFKEKFLLVWPLYIPTVVSAAGTIGCVIGVNAIHTRRYAALMGLYNLTDTALRDYKEQIEELLGPRKAEKLDNAVTQAQVDKNPVSTSEVFLTGRGEVLCYETISGRYFSSDMESLRRAQNDANAQIISDMYFSLNDLWELFGLKPTSFGEDVGWNLDHLIDLRFAGTIADDGRPCIAIEYKTPPKPRFHKMS